MGDNTKHKKAKETKKCVTKRRLMFEYYTGCLFNHKIILKLQQRLPQGDYHNVYTEQINKIARNSKMIKECKHLIKLQRIYTKKIHLKHVNARC